MLVTIVIVGRVLGVLLGAVVVRLGLCVGNSTSSTELIDGEELKALKPGMVVGLEEGRTVRVVFGTEVIR